jgi:hypothetical protein
MFEVSTEVDFGPGSWAQISTVVDIASMSDMLKELRMYVCLIEKVESFNNNPVADCHCSCV